jgi:predicted nucleotidyltransferase
VKNNGYILEQIFSPLVVFGQDFLDRLRPIAKRCINRQVYHHYRGFLNGQLKLLENENPKKAKTLLYAYRVALSGIHLLRSGSVEANIRPLSRLFNLSFVEDLIDQKRAGELANTRDVDWSFHRDQLVGLESELDRAFEECPLRHEVPRDAVNEFLIGQRLVIG